VPTDDTRDRSGPDCVIASDSEGRATARPDEFVDLDAAAITARLRAVERSLSDGDAGAPLPADRTAALAERLDAAERRLDDVEAAVQALRGYVGEIEHVNASVERRANAALAAVEDREPTHSAPAVPDLEAPARAEPDTGLLRRVLDR